MKFSTITLKADVMDGIQVVDVFDYPEAEMLPVKAFKECLRFLEDDETIFTQLFPKGTDGDWEYIEQDYFIGE